ncbi:MAG: YggS family pyridoxal phosphate-dependent enzyme [Bacteroidales bacterium]
MAQISEKINYYKETLPRETNLVAVSKFCTNEAILEAYNAGQRVFGESRVQELLQKEKTLPKDIKWHFIGHLQTNKVRSIIPFISLIHSVDSEVLLYTIDKEAAHATRTIDCLLQIHIAKEESKYGFTPQLITELLQNNAIQSLRNVHICGLMGMATNCDDYSIISDEFEQLKQLFVTIKTKYFAENPYFKEISMGMSADYKIAIEKGSTLVRIGSAIFGEREYNNNIK